MSTAARTVVYEVNLDLDADVREDYLAWLRPHIAEILALPGFLGATLAEPVDPAAEAGHALLCVQYTLADVDALQAYLRDHAPRMREEGLARFGGRFRAQRRVLQTLSHY